MSYMLKLFQKSAHKMLKSIPFQVKDNCFWHFGNSGPHSCFLLGFTKGTVNLVVPGQCVLLEKTLETVLLRKNAFDDQIGSTAIWATVYIRTLKELQKLIPGAFLKVKFKRCQHHKMQFGQNPPGKGGAAFSLSYCKGSKCPSHF